MVEEGRRILSDNLEVAYEDALVASGLPEGDQAHLRRQTEKAEGFSLSYGAICGGWRRPPPAKGSNSATYSIGHNG